MRFANVAGAALAALLLSAAVPALAVDGDTPPPPPSDTPDTRPADDTAAPRDAAPRERDEDTFNERDITNAVSDFFGIATEAAAKAVQRIFKDQGQPDAYIKGDEGSGAVVVGLRYGEGWLVRKHFDPVKVYWKGPSVGFDVGGNASKAFTLVYNLRSERRLYQRFPGVEGSYYLVAGIGINYLRSGGVTVVPMRTGIGLRAGVNAHYLVFSERRDWFPF